MTLVSTVFVIRFDFILSFTISPADFTFLGEGGDKDSLWLITGFDKSSVFVGSVFWLRELLVCEKVKAFASESIGSKTN